MTFNSHDIFMSQRDLFDVLRPTPPPFFFRGRLARGQRRTTALVLAPLFPAFTRQACPLPQGARGIQVGSKVINPTFSHAETTDFGPAGHSFLSLHAVRKITIGQPTKLKTSLSAKQLANGCHPTAERTRRQPQLFGNAFIAEAGC